jgi:hypothetical protein
MPTSEVLYRCFRTNPDGAGFAWADGKEVHWSKGFMDPHSAIKAMRSEIPKGSACLLHFRIGTHGGSGPEFTHPFPVVDDQASMYKLSGSTTGRVLVHNGIISGLGKEGVNSDTSAFTMKYAAGKTTLKKAGSHNKIAVLSPNGDIEFFGEWIQEENGVLYSNGDYEPYVLSWAPFANKAVNSFVGLKELKDHTTAVQTPDTDVLTVGNLLKKHKECKLYTDASENVYLKVPGYRKPLCIGVLEFGYGYDSREPLDEDERTFPPKDEYEDLTSTVVGSGGVMVSASDSDQVGFYSPVHSTTEFSPEAITEAAEPEAVTDSTDLVCSEETPASSCLRSGLEWHPEGYYPEL